MKFLCTKNFWFSYSIFTCFFFLSISFHLFCTFCVAKRFLKKFKLVFETSYIILLMFTPLNSPIFHQIYHQILWSRALFLFICTYSPLLELIRICENIFFLVRIFESVLFSVENWFFKSLWKQASVWILSFTMYLSSPKRDNGILLTSYISILCFFALNSSHFVSDYFFIK